MFVDLLFVSTTKVSFLNSSPETYFLNSNWIVEIGHLRPKINEFFSSCFPTVCKADRKQH